MNINASPALYSPLNVQTRENAPRSQPQQNAPTRETPETRRPQETPSSVNPNDRNAGPSEQNRRVESSASVDPQLNARRTNETREREEQRANTSADQTEASSNVREARPVVIEQQPSAATRTFLDVANQNDDFRIIDTYA